MSVVEKSIEVELPVSTVYNQWTQFEEFPQFMEASSGSWRSIDGAGNGGMVTFQPTGATATRVNLQMEFAPEGLAETIGDKLGFVSKQAEGDLKRFKSFMEDRGSETGGWRGRV